MSGSQLVVTLVFSAAMIGAAAGIAAAICLIVWFGAQRPEGAGREVRQAAAAPVTMPARPPGELGRRVLAEVPTIGPRGLARILECSPSTAHAIIRAFAAEQGAPGAEQGTNSEPPPDRSKAWIDP